MDLEQRKLTKKLLNKSQSEAEWITVMKFGMKTLLTDKPFLYEIIRENAAALPQCVETPMSLPESIEYICKNLGLKLEINISEIPATRQIL